MLKFGILPEGLGSGFICNRAFTIDDMTSESLAIGLPHEKTRKTNNTNEIRSFFFYDIPPLLSQVMCI
jgi:hypothetical protein